MAETAFHNSRLQPVSIPAVKASTLWRLESDCCLSEAAICTSNNGNMIPQKLRANNSALVLATAYGGVENILGQSLGFPMPNIEGILGLRPYSDSPAILLPLFPGLPTEDRP